MCAISINSYNWDWSESEGKRPKPTPLPHMRLWLMKPTTTCTNTYLLYFLLFTCRGLFSFTSLTRIIIHNIDAFTETRIAFFPGSEIDSFACEEFL